MSAQITYRMARPGDSGELARYMCIAGGGVYEFLFDDLIPFVTAVDLLSAGIGSERYPVSWRNSRVAALDWRETEGHRRHRHAVAWPPGQAAPSWLSVSGCRHRSSVQTRSPKILI